MIEGHFGSRRMYWRGLNCLLSLITYILLLCSVRIAPLPRDHPTPLHRRAHARAAHPPQADELLLSLSASLLEGPSNVMGRRKGMWRWLARRASAVCGSPGHDQVPTAVRARARTKRVSFANAKRSFPGALRPPIRPRTTHIYLPSCVPLDIAAFFRYYHLSFLCSRPHWRGHPKH